jgi:peptidylprolyl isomerase
MLTISLAALPLLSVAGCDKKEALSPPAQAPPPAALAPGTATPAQPATGEAPKAAPPKPEKPPATLPPEAVRPPEPAGLPAPADVAAAPANAEKSASGLAWVVLQPGTGTEKPGPRDTVEVHYTGWQTDGKMFDSSVQRGRPAKFPLNRVIKGWTEGLQLMVQGEKRRFWIPADLAYGDKPARPGAPAGLLCFEVELLNLEKQPTVDAPPDVAAPPADAKKTASGLAYKVLQPGTGTAHPAATGKVTVHYTGWMTNGEMFDSSVIRKQPATFALNGVVAGWTEGVQLMVEGEKTRFWVPPALGYGDTAKRPGMPYGMLVFDIELIKIGE